MWTEEQMAADAKRAAEARVNQAKAHYRASRDWQLDQYAVHIEGDKPWRQMTQAELVDAVEKARNRIKDPTIRDMLNVMLLTEQDTLRQDITVAELEQKLGGAAA